MFQPVSLAHLQRVPVFPKHGGLHRRVVHVHCVAPALCMGQPQQKRVDHPVKLLHEGRWSVMRVKVSCGIKLDRCSLRVLSPDSVLGCCVDCPPIPQGPHKPLSSGDSCFAGRPEAHVQWTPAAALAHPGSETASLSYNRRMSSAFPA